MCRDFPYFDPRVKIEYKTDVGFASLDFCFIT